MDGYDRALGAGPGAPIDLIAALPALYASQRRWLRKFFRERGFLSVDCDDLIQTTFLNILAARDRPVVASPQAYLYVAARSVAINHRRRLAVRNRYRSALELMEDGVEWRTPEREIETQETLRTCMHVLAAQSGRWRFIFERKRVDDWKAPRIAAEAGITVSGVEKAVPVIDGRIHDRTRGDWKFDARQALPWGLPRPSSDSELAPGLDDVDPMFDKWQTAEGFFDSEE